MESILVAIALVLVLVLVRNIRKAMPTEDARDLGVFSYKESIGGSVAGSIKSKAGDA